MDDNILQDLACEARKEIIPRFSRAKNVDNKWVYLAQLGHREFQEVEVIICRHPEQKCVNGVVHQIKHPNPESTNSNFFFTKLIACKSICLQGIQIISFSVVNMTEKSQSFLAF